MKKERKQQASIKIEKSNLNEIVSYIVLFLEVENYIHEELQKENNNFTRLIITTSIYLCGGRECVYRSQNWPSYSNTSNKRAGAGSISSSIYIFNII
jgi:hypothetical protein